MTENTNDYLIYGVDREILLTCYDYLTKGVECFRKEVAFETLLNAYAASQEGIRVISLEHREMFYQTPEDIGDITKIRKDIFSDSTHFNDAGYELFKDIFIEALDEYL